MRCAKSPVAPKTTRYSISREGDAMAGECRRAGRGSRGKRVSDGAADRWPPATLVVQGGVDERAQLAPDRVGRRRDELGEKDDRKVFDRIDPEGGAGRAAPVELAGARGEHCLGRIGEDG